MKYHVYNFQIWFWVKISPYFDALFRPILFLWQNVFGKLSDLTEIVILGVLKALPLIFDRKSLTGIVFSWFEAKKDKQEK